ncbi:hypothetical protein JWJ88_20120 [Paracoccus methylovorus]|jgi:hypothetical protein|uniref:Uncharacterized protein n=3 Tax=Paracoccus TaxID=265 RepID=A1B6G2_PARDP|nr:MULTISPECIES: DUF6522 family protein [Paracoccus]ABL71106.1 hypothetical protein Pden_3023 [Paracoccus denitrificans PD1222]MBB4628296.1 hypothetical protein [Paracoccus denitrificans]MCU7429351.1 DUF6522 family protein [Paracoccus denitrificans]MDK8873339.1 DUF6522 family protein [Paracoccus sp. SSJ]QAR27766.1 hypothetical protein EO213_15415 [Paracoccus denitrificans]
MPGIELQQDGARIDAAVLARAFGISADDLRQGMRDGTITSRFERGAGKDAGTVRLIFFSSSRRIRITADESGRILTCGAVDFAGSSGPGSRRPEAGADHGAPGSGRDPGQAAHIETLLDLALQGTFPASDPIAISIDAPRRTSLLLGKAP